MQIILVALVASILFSCNSTGNAEPEKPSGSEQLIGEWNNLSIKINTYSKNNSDSTDLLQVNRPEWEEKLKIKPIRSFFRADSTWNSAHYNLKDSLVYNPSGKWWFEKDKLVMLQDFPSKDTTIYTILFQKDTASFNALIDWDMDGKKDDEYFGRQVKVN